MSVTGPAVRPVAALILAAACWGVGTAISKQALAEIPPLTLLPIQLTVSVLFLGVIARVRGEPLPTGSHGRQLGRLGLLNPGLAYALSLAGLTLITASLSVLLWAIEPVLIVLLAALVLNERPGPVLLGMSALAILGLVLILYEPGRPAPRLASPSRSPASPAARSTTWRRAGGCRATTPRSAWCWRSKRMPSRWRSGSPASPAWPDSMWSRRVGPRVLRPRLLAVR
jgi:uncharacterized membrane protein